MISVLVLTRDEEANLATCLESVAWSDDVTVLDDGSTDRTVDIAEQRGAHVIRHSAGGENAQRTYALKEIPFKHPWVYNPDADEVTPPELRDEMMSVVGNFARPEVAYRMRFKVMFMDRWLQHSSLYPTWVMRLFRPGRIRFERATNLTYVADGPVGSLQSHFLHYPFRKGLGAWREKHRRYAELEAKENLASLRSGAAVPWGALRGDPVQRRRALKELSFRLPFRPALRFVYMYLLRMGFLDGYAGLTYCRLVSSYEREIVRIMKELAHHDSRVASAEPRP